MWSLRTEFSVKFCSTTVPVLLHWWRMNALLQSCFVQVLVWERYCGSELCFVVLHEREQVFPTWHAGVFVFLFKPSARPIYLVLVFHSQPNSPTLSCINPEFSIIFRMFSNFLLLYLVCSLASLWSFLLRFSSHNATIRKLNSMFTYSFISLFAHLQIRIHCTSKVSRSSRGNVSRVTVWG